MARYTHLLLDIDGTLLNFLKSEETALRKTMSAFGIAPTDDRCV